MMVDARAGVMDVKKVALMADLKDVRMDESSVESSAVALV